MSAAAKSLLGLAASVDRASGALVRARFSEFAEAASELEAAELASLDRKIQDDPEAKEACRKLRGSLDRLGGLLGHVAGVQQALRAVDPAGTAVYDRSGSVASAAGLLRKEA